MSGSAWCVRAGKSDVGEKLLLGPAQELHAEVIARGTFGERRIRFHENADFYETLDRIGHVPLPPYIARDDQPADRERYQTVFAQERGSVAAPTAGLHFTPAILNSIRARGVEIAEITLHVGLGTFQPVHEERVEDHICIESPIASPRTRRGNSIAPSRTSRRIVAVGTTAVRTLEFAARHLRQEACRRKRARLTCLFIRVSNFGSSGHCSLTSTCLNPRF